ncbi:MAG TPA: SRPBCC family protein [Marmoricola sp.]|nr:SRPBCC family protein [Marmoricola sp.]
MGYPFTIERSLTIPAEAAAVFAEVNDFHRWRAWSPWEGLDADLDRTYSGAQQGVGAKYAWNGKNAGAGTMEIVSAQEPRQIDVDLRFTKPFKATNPTSFAFEPTADGTKVTWRMTGSNGLVGHLFFKVFKMHDKVGADFDKGLAALSAVVTRS